MTEHRTIADLINTRKDAGKSLRGMARRATAMGTPIGASALSAYATGRTTGWPSHATRQALANALDMPIDEIVRGAAATCAPLPDQGQLDGPGMQEWTALIEGRTDEEVRDVLTVARAVLRMWDAARERPQA